MSHSKIVVPKPHRKDSTSWKAIQKVRCILTTYRIVKLSVLCMLRKLLFYNFQILQSGEKISLKHFRPVKPLGSGDTGR